MDETWKIVFESRRQSSCNERSLVLSSLDIQHEILEGEHSWAIIVPASLGDRALQELAQYARENLASGPPARIRHPEYHDALPGILAFAAILLLVTWASNTDFLSRNWYSAGRMDGELLRQGEWWRLATALTLHGSLKHLLGNLGFGALFGFFAGRLVGPGVAWLSILLASCLANDLNATLLDQTHRSIGASTAVFAALGLVAAYVWRSRIMVQDRWPYRLGPVIGGVALLAFTGTGDANTDIGAHMMGFLFGFLSGMALVYASPHLHNARLQKAGGALAIALLAISWILALQ